MLTEQELQVWEDVQRHWSQEAEEPLGAVEAPAMPEDGWSDPPLAVLIGARVVIVLLLFGAAMAALAVAVAVGVIWFLSRNQPEADRSTELVTTGAGHDRA